MVGERRLEGVLTTLAIGILRGLDLAVEIGMRAQRALRERDQRPRQDVGAFDRDADRNHLVGRLQIVARPIADGAAAVNIEGVVDGAAHPLRRLVFHERGEN